jgi:hypothetical protein
VSWADTGKAAGKDSSETLQMAAAKRRRKNTDIALFQIMWLWCNSL